MSTVRMLLPQPGTADVNDVIAGINACQTLAPFDDQTVAFAATLSRHLGRVGRGRPETEALAFWMRKAELVRLRADFERLTAESTILVPRGTVFHVPPANVDTLFVYSWLLATLVGNRNIIRMSERATEQSATIIGAIRDVSTDFPAVRDRTAMVTYGHELAITTALSAGCDVRVIWGGDATVGAVRKAPLPPFAKDLTFPDRFSLAAIKTAAYEAMSNAARDDLALRFFNDAYWFDQLGCSSPRLVVWVGDRDVVEGLAADLLQRLRRLLDTKSYVTDTATAVAKITQSFRTMIAADVTSYARHGNELVVLTVDQFPEVRGDFCGGGLFYFLHATALNDLAPHLVRSDQTLSHAGFDLAELVGLARSLNGRGVDRMVPIGKALAFSRSWDGYDLLQEFTRRVTIDVTSASPA